MIDGAKISGKMAKSLFAEMPERGEAPEKIVRDQGLEQVSDVSGIEKAIAEVLAANTQQAADYRAGNEKIFGFLVGQVMKATRGKANPQVVNDVLRKKLST